MYKITKITLSIIKLFAHTTGFDFNKTLSGIASPKYKYFCNIK